MIYWEHPAVALHLGDCREVLRELPVESVQMCVTSPPYWSLRDYRIEPSVWGGGGGGQTWRGALGLEPAPALYVEHIVEVFREVRRVLRKDGTLWLNLGDSYASRLEGGQGGTRWQGAIAAGKDPEQTRNSNSFDSKAIRAMGLKPKDLVGSPWRVAFALQADGWWLRQDIIWSKPNPMPESATDRCTKAHEYLFMMTKSERYYYDADAI